MFAIVHSIGVDHSKNILTCIFESAPRSHLSLCAALQGHDNLQVLLLDAQHQQGHVSGGHASFVSVLAAVVKTFHPMRFPNRSRPTVLT